MLRDQPFDIRIPERRLSVDAGAIGEEGGGRGDESGCREEKGGNLHDGPRCGGREVKEGGFVPVAWSEGERREDTGGLYTFDPSSQVLELGELE